jgi:uncharacterized membrane protein YbhN (UPF0104 family)
VALLAGLGVGAALVAGVFAPLAGVAIVTLDLALGWRLGRRGLTALLGVVPRLAAPVLERGIAFLETVATFFQSPPRVLLGAVAFGILAVAASFLRAVLTARFLHLPLAVPEVALVLACSLVILAIPFLPGAIGIYEGGMVAVFGLLGRPPAEGIAFALAAHGVEVAVAAVGFVFLAQLGLHVSVARRASAAPPAA